MPSTLIVLIMTGLLGAGEFGAASHSPLLAPDALQRIGMKKHWEARLPLEDHDAVTAAYLVDDALYVTTESGSMFALTAQMGLLRWGDNLTDWDYTIYKPSHIRTPDGTGPVLVPTTNELLVLDRYSGRRLQGFAHRFAPGGSVVGEGRHIFAGSADGQFYCLRLGREAGARPTQIWTVVSGGPITASPVLYGYDDLLFASQGGGVYSCAATDKRFNWSFQTGGAILGDPVVDDSGVYVASTDRSLYKLSGMDGELMWRMRFPQPLWDGPIVRSHTIYQFCSNHGLSAVDAHTGELSWHNADAKQFLAHNHGRDFLLTKNRIDVVDHESGEPVASIRSGAITLGISNTTDDALYLLSANGHVLCARQQDVPYLRRQQVAAAKERLTLPPMRDADRARRAADQDGHAADPAASDPLRSRRDYDE